MRQMHNSEPFGGCVWSDINIVRTCRSMAFKHWLLLWTLCVKKQLNKTKAKSAWERKCCLSGGSGVLGSVLAAEMCPLDEPATAALSTFGWKYLFNSLIAKDFREKSSSYWESSWPFLSEDNDGIKQEISVLKRDVKAPLGLGWVEIEKLFRFPH